jgi:hypothetical protein
VAALRWATQAAVVHLFGLGIMVAIANPARWNTRAWFLSVGPLLFWVLAVLAAAGRPEAATEEAAAG